MKKMMMLVGASLLVLTACGNATPRKATKTEEIKTGVQALNPENSTQVLTKKLQMPKSADGSSYTQTIQYQGNKFLHLTLDRVTPADEELKNIINSRGIEEAQNLLNQSLEKDEAYMSAKNVKGFQSSMTILPSNELSLVLDFDLQTLDLPEVEKNSYFASLDLKNMLQATPEKYIEYQKSQGATEVPVQ